MKRKTAIIIFNNRERIFPEAITVSDMITPFLRKLPYMSMSALIHILRTSNSMLREIGICDKRKNKQINELIDRFIMKGQRGHSKKEHVSLQTAICNMVLRSEGLGLLPEELRTFNKNDHYQETRILGFQPRRGSRF